MWKVRQKEMGTKLNDAEVANSQRHDMLGFTKVSEIKAFY
jgi:hypothetical protein